MKLCRTCKHWKQIPDSWQGNCPKHPFSKPPFSEDAERPGCADYVDKMLKYQEAQNVRA